MSYATPAATALSLMRHVCAALLAIKDENERDLAVASCVGVLVEAACDVTGPLEDCQDAIRAQIEENRERQAVWALEQSRMSPRDHRHELGMEPEGWEVV